MIKYVGKRLFYAILTILTLTVLTFFMMRMLPGDPFIGNKAIPEVTMEALNRKYGLDKPVLEQLIIYISNAFRGDLGVSIKYNRPVTDIISQAFPYSFELGIRALIFATIMGVLLGIVAAVKRGTKWDSLAMFFAIVGVSVPNFIIGSLLQYLLGLKLYQWTGVKFFPITGWGSVASKLIPSFALSFSSLATISRLMRTSMLDVLGQDYIKTAKSKGLSQKKIIWKHAVRNAIMPVITVLGPIAASVLTGAFVVENIFSIPGMGRFFVMSIQDQDYTMISGITLFYGIFLVAANLMVDLAYGFIDPRVKLTEGRE
ncbi:MAG: ABC transporter permease [Lachnospiraceae bacterium]|nr:ABC transporter permease [Lachnospiraceae bacterium]